MRLKRVAACLGCALVLSAPTARADSDTGFGIPGLYVRTDLGIANYGFGGFQQADLEASGGQFLSESIGDAPVVGFGIGWRHSQNIRFDLTGEYRLPAGIRGVDFLQSTLVAPDGTLTASTVYEGEYSAVVGLANVYVDLFKAYRITPYVGAGIGIAYSRLADIETSTSGRFEDAATGGVSFGETTGFAGTESKANLAWALMAGASYDLSENAKLDVGYRYIHLGQDVAATTDLISCTCGTIGDPLKVSDLDAHEFRIGLRWEFNEEARQ